MRKFLVGACCCVGLSAFGMEYKLGGKAESFGKFGFNNGSYDSKAFKNPTDSYASLFGAMEFDVKAQNGFSASLGGAINALVYDSTSSQGGQSLGNGYIGAWFGYKGDKAMEARQYILHNAFVGYEGEYFGFKAGRYESSGLDWFGAWNQGGELYVGNKYVKLWGFYSDSRAMVYSNWFWDYTRFSVAGKGVYAGGLDVGTDSIKLSLYTYGSQDRFVAPGVKFAWNEALGEHLSNEFVAIGLFPINEENPKGMSGGSALVGKDTLFGDKLDKYTQTLFIREQVNFYKHFAGVMLYKNWGNANAWIGSYGDPFNGFDIWIGSAYDKGASLSDMIGRNAITTIGYIGGDYGDFSWQILGRHTQSPRSDENALALTLNQRLYKELSMRVKIEYFSDVTKAGYSVGGEPPILSHNQTNDRSHIMTWLSQKF